MKLNIREFVTIIKSTMEEIQSREVYGINQEAYIPQSILIKVDSLSGKDKENFWDEIEYIAEKLYLEKGNELNSLNNLHLEISILIKERLGEFLEI